MTDHNSQFMAILTAVGEAKQANANALGIPWVITSMAVGDANGTEPMPQRGQSALINERHRALLTQLMIDEDNDSMIIAELVIPEHIGGWWIREIGLYDEDGDLVVIANCPPTYKPELTQGSGRTQVIRLNIIVSSAQSVELKIDPSVVLATREYVDTLLVRATKAEAEAGADPLKFMTPLRTAQAIAAQGLKLGSTASTAAAGNDTRLTDAREWTAAMVSQAEAEAGVATTARKWTAQRVAQAVAALGLKLGITAGTAAAGNDSRITGAVQTAGTGLTKSGTELSVNYGTTAGTAAQGNDSRITGAVQTASTGLTKSGTALSVNYGTTAGTAAQGNDSRITGAVQTAGTGLTKSGTAISVNYGTTAGTAVEGNDPRLGAAGDWAAEIVSQVEAETGTATTARKWTAQRVAQAIAALGLKIGDTAGTAAAGNDSRITGAVQSGGTGLYKTGTSLNVNYGTTANTAAAGNDARIVNAVSTAGTGLSKPNASTLAIATSHIPIGVGQTWKKMGYVPGSTYTNTTGRPIMVNIVSLVPSNPTAVSREVLFYVNDVRVARMDAETNTDSSLSAIVPNGQTYRVTANNQLTNTIEWYVLS